MRKNAERIVNRLLNADQGFRVVRCSCFMVFTSDSCIILLRCFSI